MAVNRVYPEDIQCVFEGHSPLGKIFVSNVEAAQNASTLQKHGIKAVVTVARGAFLNHDEAFLPNYLYIPAEDIPEFQLAPYFEISSEQTYRQLQFEVLVHCMAGISRSVTIVAAYIVRKFKKTSEEALGQIRRKRSIINPNEGFIRQLKLFSLSTLVEDREQQREIGRRPRKMSDNTNEVRRSNSVSKILFSPSFRQAKGKTLKKFEKKTEKDAGQDQSTQPTLKLARVEITASQPTGIGRFRSLSAFDKSVTKVGPSSTVPSINTESLQRPVRQPQPILSLPTTTTFKTESLLMAKLHSGEASPSPSRLRQTTKYESYRFRNGQDLRSNILRYYKVTGFR